MRVTLRISGCATCMHEVLRVPSIVLTTLIFGLDRPFALARLMQRRALASTQCAQDPFVGRFHSRPTSSIMPVPQPRYLVFSHLLRACLHELVGCWAQLPRLLAINSEWSVRWCRRYVCVCGGSLA